MQMKSALSLALSLVFSFFAHAGTLSASPVNRVLDRYRQAGSVEAKVKKTVSQEWSGAQTESEGLFYFAKGKLRLDIEKPDRSTLVYDGKSIWLESRLDDNHIQVSHMKAGDLRRSDSLLAAIFDRKDVLKDFKLLKSKAMEGQKIYTFAPRHEKGTEVRELVVALKGKEIRRISYKDQLENEVTFEFSDVTEGAKASPKLNYKPPKGADVTEI
jgi:outer membrane lipoprotein-sorting protein